MIKNGYVTKDIHATLATLQNPSQILNSISQTIEVYHKIAKQPDVFSVSQTYKDTICNMDLSCTDTWIDEYLQKTKIAHQLLRYAVSARDYGFAVIEIVEYQNFNGKIVPTQIDLSPIEKFHFDTDRVLRLKTKTDPIGIDVFKTYPNKFILIQNESSFANPYGVALLDIAYWLAVGINGNFEFMLQFAEEDGRDTWIAKHSPDSTEEQKNEMLNMLVNLRGNRVGLYEDGAELECKPNTGRNSTTDLYKTINEICLRKIEKLWTGTELTMQVEGKGGYSSSQTGVEIKEDAISQGKRLVFNALEQLLSIINKINNSNAIAEFGLFAKNETTESEAKIDKIYFDMGLKPTPKFFANRGYDTDEYTISTNPAPNTTKSKPKPNTTDFEAKPPSLKDLFDIFKDDLTDDPKKPHARI